MEKESIRGKRRARKLALQALYQWHMCGAELTEIDAQCRAFNDMTRVDADYFNQLLYEIPKMLPALEAAFTPYLDRPLQDLNPIELSVLRIGAYELIHRLEIPYRVVLDESVNLTKEFGSQDGHRYVNGVLHQLAKQARTIEVNAQNG